MQIRVAVATISRSRIKTNHPLWGTDYLQRSHACSVNRFPAFQLIWLSSTAVDLSPRKEKFSFLILPRPLASALSLLLRAHLASSSDVAVFIDHSHGSLLFLVFASYSLSPTVLSRARDGNPKARPE